MALFVNDLELVEEDISYGDLEEVTHVTFEKPLAIENYGQKFPVDQININPDVIGGVVIWVTVRFVNDKEPIQIDFSLYKFTKGTPTLIKEY